MTHHLVVVPLRVSLYGRGEMEFDDDSEGEDVAPVLAEAGGHDVSGANVPDVPELVVAEGENPELDDVQTDVPEFADQSGQATVDQTVGQLDASADDLLEDDDTIVASEELSPAPNSQTLKAGIVDLEAAEREARGLLAKIASTPLAAYRTLRLLTKPKNGANGQRARKSHTPDSGPPNNLVSATPWRVIPKPAYYRRD